MFWLPFGLSVLCGSLGGDEHLGLVLRVTDEQRPDLGSDGRRELAERGRDGDGGRHTGVAVEPLPTELGERRDGGCGGAILDVATTLTGLHVAILTNHCRVLFGEFEILSPRATGLV